MSEKVPAFVKYEMVCAAIRGDKEVNNKVFPEKFPYEILVSPSAEVCDCDEDTAKRKVPLLVGKNNIVQEIDLQQFSDLIVLFCRGTTDESFQLVDMTAKRCARHYLQTTPLSKRPPLFVSKDDPGFCFTRLPFNLTPIEELKENSAGNFVQESPLFYEFLSRCSNKEALCAFIGSIFEPKSDLSQYLWIYGDGRDGKSKLLNFVAAALGKSYASENEDLASKFGPTFVRNKRVIGFADFENPEWPSKTPLVKRITGEDLIRMEIKGGDVFSETVPAKLIFTSNRELQVETSKADTRRVIYVCVKSFEGEKDPLYLQKLLAEAQGVIDHCRLIYHRLCPRYEEIPVDEEAQQSVYEEYTAEIENIIESYFQLGAEYTTKPSDIMGRYKSVKTTVPLAKFYKYLLSSEKVTKESKWCPKLKQSRVRYIGIRPRVPLELVALDREHR